MVNGANAGAAERRPQAITQRLIPTQFGDLDEHLDRILEREAIEPMDLEETEEG